MMPAAIDLAGKLSKFSERWSPKIVARMNDHDFKLVKLQGEFVGHECRATLVEAAGTVNTGAAGGDKTAPSDAWI